MFCYKCGKELPDYAKFCNACGANVGAILSDLTEQPKAEEPVNNSQNAESDLMQNHSAFISNSEVEKQVDVLSDAMPQDPTDEKTVMLSGEAKTEIPTDNADLIIPKQMEVTDEPKKKGGLRFLIIGIVIVLLLIGFIFLLMTGKLDFMSKKESTATESVKEQQTEEMAEATDDAESAEDASATEKEEGTEEPEAVVDNYTPLVAVSVDRTKIYEEANPESNILFSLEIGTYVKWYGENQLFDEEVYYKVKSLDDSVEGYVADSEVTAIHYDADLSFSSLIETDTTQYTYDMMAQDIYDLCEQYPDILSYKIIGTSYDNRDLYCVTLGNQNAPKHIMVQAAIHGREYMTTQLVMKMIEYYAKYYYDGEYDGVKYSDLFNTTAFHIVTMSNPDGVTIAQLGASALNDPKFTQFVYDCYEQDKYTMKYEIDTNGDLLWGDYWKQDGFNVLNSDNPKLITFDEFQTQWKGNAAGVDINKNFDAAWDQVVSKPYPSYADYKGPYPLSDVETCLLYSQASAYEYECFLSYHSRGNLIYYDVNGNSDENSIASGNLALSIHNLNKYTLSNNKTAYNVSLGGFGDWVQLSLNKPSVTIECGKRPCPLMLDEFDSMYFRNREVWAMLAKEYMN